MVITSIIQYSSSSLRVETEEAEIFNSKSFFLASRYKTNGELPLLDLLCNAKVTEVWLTTASLIWVNMLSSLCWRRVWSETGWSERRRGRDEGRKWGIKMKKITELSKHLIDCDKGNLGLNLLNDGGTHLNDAKTVWGIEIWWRYVSARCPYQICSPGGPEQIH